MRYVHKNQNFSIHLNESIQLDSIEAIKSKLTKYPNCVCMYTRNIHNINDTAV